MAFYQMFFFTPPDPPRGESSRLLFVCTVTRAKANMWCIMVAQCVALLPHSKKVVGSSPALCNMSGLVPRSFCAEFACSPRVHPGSPHRTPTIKTCKKSRCSSVLTLTKSGPSTWTWSPGAASLAAHCKKQRTSSTVVPPACVCVCVCVCVTTHVCNVCACRVAIKRACPPDLI